MNGAEVGNHVKIAVLGGIRGVARKTLISYHVGGTDGKREFGSKCRKAMGCFASLRLKKFVVRFLSNI